MSAPTCRHCGLKQPRAVCLKAGDQRMFCEAGPDPEFLEVLKLCQQGLDILFARLIEMTPAGTPGDRYFPSESGAPWTAITRANALIQRLEGRS